MLIRIFIFIYIFLDCFILLGWLTVDNRLAFFYLSTCFFASIAALILSPTLWACSDIPMRMWPSKFFCDSWPVMLRSSRSDSTPNLYRLVVPLLRAVCEHISSYLARTTSPCLFRSQRGDPFRILAHLSSL